MPVSVAVAIVVGGVVVDDVVLMVDCELLVG